MTWEHKPRMGVRFSAFDLAAIVICAAVCLWAWPTWKTDTLLLPFVLGHFFLFCNVFRVRRWTEWLWGGLLLVNVALCIPDSEKLISDPPWLPWGPVLAGQLPLTVLFLALEVCSRRYHGIWSRQINPGYENKLRRSPAEEPPSSDSPGSDSPGSDSPGSDSSGV